MLNLFDESKYQDVVTVHEMKERVKKAAALEELREIHEEIIPFIQGLEASGLSINNRYNSLNDIHDVLTRKAVSFAYDTTRETIGTAPGERYCFFSMGSSARHEQTIWTDQDNGLIYQTGHEDKRAVEAFTEEFSRTAVHYLAEVGYPLCQGNVMASNLRWRNSDEGWKDQLSSYLNKGSEDDLKYMMIMLDTKPVYGLPALLYRLREWIVQEIRQRPFILKKMVELVTSHEIPINMFGMIFTERWGKYAGRFDLKQGVFAPFTNNIKLLSLLYGEGAQSTRERIFGLNEKGCFSSLQMDECVAAYDFLLELRLAHSIDLKEMDDRLDYHLWLTTMDSKAAQQLKRTMKLTKLIQKQIKKRGTSFEQSAGI